MFLRIVLVVIGTVLVGVGILGIFLPLLPTTPFLLLAAACYAKSSNRFYNWLLGSRWLGTYIRNWREGRGIPLKTKVFVISLLILTMGYSIVFVVPNLAGKIVLVLIAIAVIFHVISISPKKEFEGVKKYE
ncbi:MAG: YbaN family protein [Candidatus Saganbacteria bacterium]|nr:YbaN family protein [Candidatus Saganbacteria bacterium]